MTIGQRISKLRMLRGWKQIELGSKVWQPTEVVNDWERDAVMPDMNVAMNLAKVFGISLDFLYMGDQNTAGDRDAANAIAQHDRFSNLRKSNIETVENCKRILKELSINKLLPTKYSLSIDINSTDADADSTTLEQNFINEVAKYTPQLSADCSAFVDYGIFDKNDFNLLDKNALLKHNLTKLVLHFFKNTITYVDAVKCDDIDLYETAERNRLAALQELEHKNNQLDANVVKGYGPLLNQKKILGFKEYKKRSQNIGELNKSDTFVEDLDWALYNLDYDLPNIYSIIVHLIDKGAEYFDIIEYTKVATIVSDVAKTRFTYRVAKDMVEIQNSKFKIQN